MASSPGNSAARAPKRALIRGKTSSDMAPIPRATGRTPRPACAGL